MSTTTDIQPPEGTRKLKVFISYAREDMGFVDRLDCALKGYELEPQVDRSNILAFEEWWKRIEDLIRKSDAFIFVLSPDSIGSNICARELALAESLNKRLAPVLFRPVNESLIPQALAKLNFFSFIDERFQESVTKLAKALATDVAWVRKHTEYGEAAGRWVAVGRPRRSSLLRSPELEEAERWIASRPATAPAPTREIQDFIAHSREAASWRRNILSSALAAGFLLALVLASLAYWQREVARHLEEIANEQRRAAIENRTRAEETRNEALLSQSKFLAELSNGEAQQGDPATAVLLALEALPDPASKDEALKDRPYWAPARVALDSALRVQSEIGMLKGHESAVTSIAITRDGAHVVTGSWDTTIRIWNTHTEVQEMVLRGHQRRVTSVAVTPDGTRIVSGSDDGTAQVWSMQTGKPLMTLRGHLSRVSSVAVTLDNARIITGSDDKTARVWDARTGAQLAILGGHQWEVSAVAATPDGSYIITATSGYEIIVWDAKSLTRVHELQHFQGVTSIAMSADGARIATGSDNGTVAIWDIRKGVQLKELGPRGIGVKDLAFAHDGKRIVAVSGIVSKQGQRWMEGTERDYRIRIWDVDAGTELLELKANSSVMSVALMPDASRILAGLWDSTVRIFDSRFDPAVLTLKGHERSVDAVAVTPDGQRIITGSLDNTARVWDAHTGAQLLMLRGHEESGINSVAASPDGTRIVTGSTDGTARIWDAASGAQLRVLRGDGDWITGVAFTPDGNRIVTGSGYRHGRSWSTKESIREKVARIWDAHSGELITTLVGHANGVTSVAVTRDGKQVITGSVDGTARIWDAETGTELRALRGEERDITSVAVSPDGARVVAGAWSGLARVWDAHSGAQLLELRGHTSLVVAVAVSPDGRRIATGSVDRTARIWDAQTGTELAVLKGHTEGITSIAITPDATHIVTGSEDGTVRIWDVYGDGNSMLAQAKRSIPQCLTPGQRKQFYLSPKPPSWCISMEKWPYDPASALIQGWWLLVEGKDDEAQILFTAAELKTDPKVWTTINAYLATVYIFRGGQMISAGDEDRANELFMQALKLDPSAKAEIDEAWARAKVEYGSILLSELKDDQAIETFNQALTRNGSVAVLIDQAWAAAYSDRATNMIRLGEIGEARSSLSEALKRHPSTDTVAKIARSYNEIAWHLFLKGTSADGLADAEQAVALAPNTANYLDTRGQIYLGLGRAEAACTDFQRATEIGIASAGTYYGLGLCTEKLGQLDSAARAYRKALELDSSGSDYEKTAKLKAKQRLEALAKQLPTNPIH
jgi:WD40 repeat protein